MIGRPPLGTTETNLIGETMTKFTKEQQQILEDVINFDGKRVNILNRFTGGFLLWSVEGNVWGNVEGNVEGSVEGSVLGNVWGYVEGYVGFVKGNVKGGVWGNVGGNVKGYVGGDVGGNVKGDVWGNVEGDVGGNVGGHVWGNVLGYVEGYVGGSVGHVKGDVYGNVGGDVWGNVKGSVVKGIKEKTDLTKNTTPFHFLCVEDQERIRSWPHGICRFNFFEKKWRAGNDRPHLGSDVYRTSPAPTETTQTIDGMEFKITYEEGGTNPKIERKESK